MEDKDLDKLFRDAFVDIEETPSGDVWNAIANKLDSHENIVPIRKRTNWWAYGAAAILLLTLGSYFGTQLYTRQEHTIIHEKDAIASIDQAEEDKATIILDRSEDLTQQQTEKEKNTPLIIENNRIQNHTQGTIVQANASKRTIEQIDALPETQLLLSTTEIAKQTDHFPVVRQVTEIDDIKPLIDFDEETETMLASTSTEPKERKHIITSLLNTISENIDPKKTKEVRFYADEEGSFSLSIINSIAKNPSKKRK